MSGANEPPVCIAIVICNDFIEDRRSGNKTLIGLFNAVGVNSLPAVHNKMVVMVSITNTSANLPITLLLRAPSGAEVARINADFAAEHPLAVYDLVFELLGLELPEYGTYNIDLHAGNTYLCGRRFDVLDAKSLPQAQG